VIDRADARFSASIMMSCSMTHLLMGAVWLCIRKQSAPRADSW
jgi:hypothetical protein